MLKEAHRLNEEEKPVGFKYKVRGPPWAMKIVKVQEKYLKQPNVKKTEAQAVTEMQAEVEVQAETEVQAKN